MSLATPNLSWIAATLACMLVTGCNFTDNVSQIEESPDSSSMTRDMSSSMTPDALTSGDQGGGITPGEDMPTLPDIGECQRESDITLCAQRGAQCGTLEVLDNCGITRTVMCSPCAAGFTCNDAENRCECAPQSDQELCDALGLQCGTSRTLDHCNEPRNIDCNDCPRSDVLCEENMCSGCAPESQNDFCERLGAECGLVSGTDNCGDMRTDVACGVCNAPETCAVDFVCACIPEDRETFCGRLGKNCGVVSGMDNCGDARIENCGDSCPQGTCQQDNTCSVCMPESDQAFCSRQSASCGQISGTDNCGNPRTVSNCGPCNAGEQCNNNQCVCPIPSCPNASSCGTISNACGGSVDCGGCAPDETCNGNNQCVCPSPVCGTSAGECGTISNACGGMTNCGSCSGANESCANNICVCIAESDQTLCDQQLSSCGTINVTDSCGMARTINCGTCRFNEVCQGNRYCCPNNGMLCLEER